MAGEAASRVASKGQAWLREDTRAAILKAARGLFDKGGIDTLSLGAVATETGFAPPTVYAYFASKNDLLVATVANDLAGLARAMRDVYPFARTEERPNAAAIETPIEVIPQAAALPEQVYISPEPVVAPSSAEPTREPQLFDDLAQSETRAASVAINLPAVGKKRRLLERREIAPDPLPLPEKSEVSELVPHPERLDTEPQPATEPPAPPTIAPEGDIASLKESVAKLETRKVDAWLERRLRVFEKSLADVETRLSGTEQTSTRASALVEETSKILAQRLEGAEKRLRDGLENLTQRLENSEKRPRGIPPDLRATINDLYARLENLEAGHNTAVANELEAQWSAPVEMQPEPAAAAAREPEKPITAAAETYLTVARRAATAAAQLADMEERPERSHIPFAKRFSRTQLMIALCGALVFLLVVYGFILRDFFVAQTGPAPQPAAPHHAAANTSPTAFQHAEALASHGDVNAELMLGLDYLNGTGVAKTPPQAARWLQLAAEGGEPVAQFWFATLFERGAGVKADPALAFHWYQTAAMQGNRRAIYNVAIAYAVGRGTPRDMSKAADWFRRAAELGYVDAQYNLAVLYERGDGVPESLADAYKWYAIAGAAGDTESKSRISVLATQLSPDDLSAAQSAAASFKPEPLNRAANILPILASRG